MKPKVALQDSLEPLESHRRLQRHQRYYMQFSESLFKEMKSKITQHREYHRL
jgi:hypothetical protein